MGLTAGKSAGKLQSEIKGPSDLQKLTSVVSHKYIKIVEQAIYIWLRLRK
jgi:hypothetical protein